MQLPLTELTSDLIVDEDLNRIKSTGIRLVNEGRGRDAAQVLDAYCKQHPDDGHARSYLGLAFAMSQKGKIGLKMCREVADSHPFDAEIHHNLGRVYLLAGRRRMAWETFVLASRLDADNPMIQEDLSKMGKRRPPVIPSLPRSHPVNVLAGRLLRLFGMR